jgi:hypothetical protein
MRGSKGIEAGRIMIEARKHFACKGGKGRGCAACGDTGEAGIAFIRELRQMGLDVTPNQNIADFRDDNDQDRILDVFAAVCFGENSERTTQVVSVMEHRVDRAAMDTVWRLCGGLDKLFNWLCDQERAHCRFKRNV